MSKLCILLLWVVVIPICIGEPIITEIKTKGLACASIATAFQNLKGVIGEEESEILVCSILDDIPFIPFKLPTIRKTSLK